MATGETNQTLPVADPDSLKSMPDGSLILTGLNAAHGLVFMPAAPSAPDLTASLQTLSQDLYQAFANLGVSAGQTGSLGSGGATLHPSIPSVASIISVVSGNASNALAGMLPVANAENATLTHSTARRRSFSGLRSPRSAPGRFGEGGRGWGRLRPEGRRCGRVGCRQMRADLVQRE